MVQFFGCDKYYNRKKGKMKGKGRVWGEGDVPTPSASLIASAVSKGLSMHKNVPRTKGII